jgi:hypothetical protein
LVSISIVDNAFNKSGSKAKDYDTIQSHTSISEASK